MTHLIEIDGASGEGGGQIVRSALGLAIATGRGFRLTNVRGGRARPGLLRQHLTSALAARDLCGGTVEGAELGSRELTFWPGPARPGAYRWVIGSAGSTLLVMQALLPAVLSTAGAWTLELEGGTHNPLAPSVEFFVRALVPLLARMGVEVTARLHQAGFHPAGGGRLTIEIVSPDRLQALELPRRGLIEARQVIATVANLPRQIAEREITAVCERLRWSRDGGRIEQVRGPGPGNTVSIVVASEHVTEVFTAHGARGVPAERVAALAADEAATYLAAGVAVGPHLADQLLVPMALGGGGSFETMALTDHATTQIELIRRFLGAAVGVRHLEGERWLVTVEPRAR